MPSSVPTFFVVGLVVAGSTPAAARAAQAQPFEATLGGTVAQAALRAGQDARAVRQFDLTLDAEGMTGTAGFVASPAGPLECMSAWYSDRAE